jgi:hypothetical protein
VGVKPDQYPSNLVHCPGDNSVLYLFHVDRENWLNIWLCRMNDCGHGGAGLLAAVPTGGCLGTCVV